MPLLLTVAMARQPGPPQEFVPGSFGFPLPSSAMFHIRPECELCSIAPIHLSVFKTFTTGDRKREVRCDLQVVHEPLTHERCPRSVTLYRRNDAEWVYARAP